MGTPVTMLESMAHVTAKGLQSEDKGPFLILPGSSVSRVVVERPVYYCVT